jgi:C-terminal processing protease CtpA/Prc
MRLLFACCVMVVTTLTHAQAYDAPVDRETRGKVLEACAAALKRSYIFEDVGERMAQALQDRNASGAYEELTSSQGFVRQVNADLQAISRDKHLRLDYSPEGAPSTNTEAASEALARRERFEREVNYGFERVERLNGNVGYLEMTMFLANSPRAEEVASAAMTFLAQADALIIDLRRHRGGNPGMVAYVSSYLFDERVHLNDIFSREPNHTEEFWTRPDIAGRKFGGTKPVIVLTSRETFSGAEEFAYNLQALKRATIVGETTRGGAHPTGQELVAEHFVLWLPRGRAINPITKSNWEGTGVIPDVVVPAGAALDKARDLALRALHRPG